MDIVLSDADDDPFDDEEGGLLQRDAFEEDDMQIDDGGVALRADSGSDSDLSDAQEMFEVRSAHHHNILNA